MSALLRTTVRAGLVGGLAVLAATGSAAAAHAESGDLAYTCLGSPNFTVTARFDTSIPDGATYRRGHGVFLAPVTGSIVLPEDVVDRLRDAGVQEVKGGGSVLFLIEGRGAQTEDLFDATIAETSVPATGPMTLPFEDDDPGVSLIAQRGTNNLVFAELNLSVFDSAGGPDGAIQGLQCELVDEGDVAVDTFVATAAPTATAEPSTTSSAVRPDLVQTDAPADEGTSGVPAALLGVGALTAAALGWSLRRSDTTRQH